MFRRNRQNIILDSLRAHLIFFDAAIERHGHWISEMTDPEVENLHLEIIGLIRQTREKYEVLVDKYSGHTK